MQELAVYTPHKISGEALCRLLKMKDVHPRYFHNPEELLEKIRIGDASALLLELSSVPRIGEDVEQLLAMAQEIPVIMATPYGINEKELESFHRKGYHILEKPIQIAELLKILHSLSF